MIPLASGIFDSYVVVLAKVTLLPIPWEATITGTAPTSGSEHDSPALTEPLNPLSFEVRKP